MTHPVDWNALYGVGSPVYDQMYKAQVDRVNDFYNQMMGREAAVRGQAAPVGVPTQQAQAQPAGAGWSDEDLVGAATYYGMPEAAVRAAPRAAVIDFVNKQRAAAHDKMVNQELGDVHHYVNREQAEAEQRRVDAIRAQGGYGLVGETLAALAMPLIGGAEQITGGLGHLPGIGEWLGKQEIVKKADQGFRQMEEMVRSWAPPAEQPLLSAGNVAGAVAQMWYPGTAAWSVAGKIGEVMPLVSRLTPIGRAAVRGGLSSYLLEGGTKESDPNKLGHVAEVVGLGAGIGAGMDLAAPMLSKLVQRIHNAYVPPEMLAQGDLAGIGRPMDEAMPGNYGPGGSQAQPGLDDLAAQGDPQAKTIWEYLHGPSGPSGQIIPSAGPRPGPSPAGDIQTQIPGSLPEQGLGRGPNNAPTAGLFQNPNLPEVGLRPERKPMAPEIGQQHEAEALASQMNKAGIIIQSNEFPRISSQTELDDSAVLDAMQSDNPGGTNVLQGIMNPAQTVAGQTRSVRFANRDGRLDMLVADEPLDSRAVSQYERFGMFSGQRAITPNGETVTVQHISNDGTAIVKPIYGDVLQSHPVNTLHPWLTSPQTQEVPGLWDAFQQYSTLKAGELQSAMGGGLSPEIIGSVKAKNMATWMESFFDELGITKPGDRDRISQYFNQRYVDGFKAMAPQANAEANVAMAQAATVTPTLTPVGALDQAARMKGFVAIPSPGGKWTLKDQLLSTTGQQTSQLSFGSREAAETWVHQINRDLPDVSPDLGIPGELVQQHPQPQVQLINLAEKEPALHAEAVAEVEGMTAPPAGQPPAKVHGQQGNIAVLKSRYNAAMDKLMPQRRLFSSVDETMHQHLGGSYNLAGDYDGLGSKLNIFHSSMAPYQDELAEIFAGVKNKKIYSGEWGTVYEMEDDAARLAKARDLGWNDKEVASLDSFEQLMHKLFPETGLDEARELRRYFSHIAARQSDPDLMGRAWEGFNLGQYTEPFFKLERTGNLNFREMNPLAVGDRYIRSVFWDKLVAENFDTVQTKWKSLIKNDEALSPAGNLMLGWLDIVKNGYHPEDDAFRDVVHSALKKLVDPAITRQQAKELILGTLNSSYSGLIGYRPNMIARHFFQMTYALPRAGTDLVSTMGRAMSGGMKDILAEAEADGAVAPRAFTINAPGSMEAEMNRVGTGEGLQTPQGTADIPHTRRFQAAVAVRDGLWDAMPDFLKGEGDSLFKPMGAFSRAVERFQAIVYSAGKQRATNALKAFRAGGATDFDTLMGDSMARTFDPAWQRTFQQMVAANDDAGAAKFLGRQLRDATFFKYGGTETPAAARSVTGRVWMQLGLFENNYLQFLRESAVNGTTTDRVKTLLSFAATTAGLEAASRETGWNFRWLNPWFALGFGGGPWLGMILAAGSGVTHTWKALSEGDLSEYDKGTTGLTQASGAGWQMLSPVGGLVRDAQGIATASESPYPGRALARYAITGQVDNSPDVNQWLQQSSPQFQQQLQPHQSPVRAGGVGLPPGVVSPQPVTDPTLLQDPRSIPQSVTPSAGATGSGLGISPGGIETVPRVYPQLIRR